MQGQRSMRRVLRECQAAEVSGSMCFAGQRSLLSSFLFPWAPWMDSWLRHVVHAQHLCLQGKPSTSGSM